MDDEKVKQRILKTSQLWPSKKSHINKVAFAIPGAKRMRK